MCALRRSTVLILDKKNDLIVSMKQLFVTDSKVFAASIVGLALILTSMIGGSFAYQVKNLDYTLAVTGSAKRSVVADTAKWSIGFSRTMPAYTIKSGYEQMAKDLVIVKKFLADRGVVADDIEVSPIFMDQYYSQRTEHLPASEREYSLRQSVTIRSSDVQKISEISGDLQSLVIAGVFASTQSLEYSYSALPELRVSLLADAVRDAKARADQIAESGGRRVGDLRNAASGVVQVLPKGSVDVSDYGAYDMSSIEKEVMVTVRASFSLR